VFSPFATAAALYIVHIIVFYALSKDSYISILIYIVDISSINYVSLQNKAWGLPTNNFVVFLKQQAYRKKIASIQANNTKKCNCHFYFLIFPSFG